MHIKKVERKSMKKIFYYIPEPECCSFLQQFWFGCVIFKKSGKNVVMIHLGFVKFSVVANSITVQDFFKDLFHEEKELC